MEKTLLDQQARTFQAVEYNRRLHRICGELEGENELLRAALKKRKRWFRRYWNLIDWARGAKSKQSDMTRWPSTVAKQPGKAQRGQNVTQAKPSLQGIGLELSVLGMLLVSGLANAFV